MSLTRQSWSLYGSGLAFLVLVFLTHRFISHFAVYNRQPDSATASSHQMGARQDQGSPDATRETVSSLRYESPDSGPATLSFTLPQTLLQQLRFPLRFDAESPTRSRNLVFVLAASARFLYIVMDAIAIVQRLFHDNEIFYYDLEQYRSDKTALQIAKLVSQLCNVRYRRFDYSRLPPHVKHLLNYAFKPIVIHEVLQEYSRVFWIDSSIRFTTSNLSTVAQLADTMSHGIAFFDNTGHNIVSATHPHTYRYLPTDTAAATRTTMYGASAVYLDVGQKLYDAVISWWLLCALEPKCIAPTTVKRHCVESMPVNKYRKCHRFDQTALNILVANLLGFNTTRYVPDTRVLQVRRGSRHQQKLTVCEPGKKRKLAKARKFFPRRKRKRH